MIQIPLEGPLPADWTGTKSLQYLLLIDIGFTGTLPAGWGSPQALPDLSTLILALLSNVTGVRSIRMEVAQSVLHMHILIFHACYWLHAGLQGNDACVLTAGPLQATAKHTSSHLISTFLHAGWQFF